MSKQPIHTKVLGQPLHTPSTIFFIIKNNIEKILFWFTMLLTNATTSTYRHTIILPLFFLAKSNTCKKEVTCS
ncbi:hypothetical protein HYC85_025814 [Camellia sinensis]|uniref:Uncharacterized protein n=1 Tax=Camellia sinensis TaxID=4442 RepID=A0A7J7GFY7_CAMSI|nr:hypothetical protein HYC85_025814 [Camellia sinensis]